MKNVYLIYGSNYELIKREIDNIVKDITDVVKYDLQLSPVDEVIDDASMISLFGEKKVVIAENAMFLTTNKSSVDHNIDYLISFLNNHNSENIVIFTCYDDKLDERKKVVKLFREKATVIYKKEVTKKDIPSFVISEFKNMGYIIDYKTASYFSDYVGENIDIIISEINKMTLYKADDKQITIKDINDISSKAFKDNIFDFLDAVQKRNYKKMFECYDDLKIIGEEPIKIISMLGKQLFLIYQVKLLSKNNTQDDIANILKIHPYRVKLALESDFLEYELTDLIKKLHNLDYEIKSGKKDKDHAFESFLLKL